MDRPLKDYMVTLSSGSPDWKTSKWIVQAEDKSTALNYAILLHDDKHHWPVAMLTMSYQGSNPEINESEYEVADPALIYRLDRIREHGLEKLENC